jgi:hypothetical protein
VDDRVAAVKAALEPHPAVASVELVGSRATGRTHRLSDWDIYVRTDYFRQIFEDLPTLVEPLEPLHSFWDPYGKHEAFIVIFTGPTKVDICFFDEPRNLDSPYEVTAESLPRMDRHFWDWILWTEQKRLANKEGLMRESLQLMFTHMLRPMGVEPEPVTVRDALTAYLEARDRLEGELGISVPRELEREVCPVISRN